MNILKDEEARKAIQEGPVMGAKEDDGVIEEIYFGNCSEEEAAACLDGFQLKSESTKQGRREFWAPIQFTAAKPEDQIAVRGELLTRGAVMCGGCPEYLEHLAGEARCSGRCPSENRGRLNQQSIVQDSVPRVPANWFTEAPFHKPITGVADSWLLQRAEEISEVTKSAAVTRQARKEYCGGCHFYRAGCRGVTEQDAIRLQQSGGAPGCYADLGKVIQLAKRRIKQRFGSVATFKRMLYQVNGDCTIRRDGVECRVAAPSRPGKYHIILAKAPYTRLGELSYDDVSRGSGMGDGFAPDVSDAGLAAAWIFLCDFESVRNEFEPKAGGGRTSCNDQVMVHGHRNWLCGVQASGRGDIILLSGSTGGVFRTLWGSAEKLAHLGKKYPALDMEGAWTRN